jgi:hypothetical protein
MKITIRKALETRRLIILRLISSLQSEIREIDRQLKTAAGKTRLNRQFFEEILSLILNEKISVGMEAQAILYRLEDQGYSVSLGQLRVFLTRLSQDGLLERIPTTPRRWRLTAAGVNAAAVATDTP